MQNGFRSLALTLIALAAASAVVWALLPEAQRLTLEHDVRLELARHSKVARLKVPGLPGLRMFLHPNDSVITHRIMADGVWEANETHWVSRFVGTGDTFVDVGANVGYFTIIAATLVGDEGHVFAFEPDPIAFSVLERNVKLNGLTNVTLEQKAVSNEPGVIQLFLSEKNKGDHRIFDAEGDRKPIDVEAVALDDYFDGYSGAIDFVKIDTQGAEGLIVAGMDRILKQNDDIVMGVEFWPSGLAGLGTNAADFLELLRSYDMLFFDLGLGVGGVRDLIEVQSAGLVRRFTGANATSFTNLLALRGYNKAQELGRATANSNRAVLADTPELLAAQADWEREISAKIAADDTSIDAPPGLRFVLARPADKRTLEQKRSMKRYFRSITPLLVNERAEAKAAGDRHSAYVKSVLNDRMRNAAPATN